MKSFIASLMVEESDLVIRFVWIVPDKIVVAILCTFNNDLRVKKDISYELTSHKLQTSCSKQLRNTIASPT